MAVKVSSWNLERRLSTGIAQGERGTPDKIVEHIKELDADVVVLPEAYEDETAPFVDEKLHGMGYEWRDVSYEDRVGNDDRSFHMRIMSRLAIETAEQVRWADFRNMLAVTVTDPETGKQVRITGVHLSDLSSQHRVEQAKDAAGFFNNSNLEQVAIGGWNELSPHDPRARLLGSGAARFAARHIPSSHELDEDVRQEDLRGLVMRTTDMARSLALSHIEQTTDLRELSSRHKATTSLKMNSLEWMPAIPLVQIDNAYASSGIARSNVKVGPDKGSYHRDISMDIRLAA